jgi:RNA polymerase sigma-70 factor, ECF subfamily
MSTTMIAPKIFEPFRVENRNDGPEEDCFDLVKMFGGRILRLARYITRSAADAEDVLTETFLQACPDRTGSRTNDAMRVHLVMLAVKKALERLGHRRHAGEGDNLCEDVVIREIFAWGDDYQGRHSPEQTTDILEQAMWSLDPMCRAVFVLRDIEEIPVEQTAQALNRSVAAVEVCHLRARLQLRERLARSFQPSLPTLEDTALSDYRI